MTITYGRGLPPEKISHSYVDRHGATRTFTAIGTGSGGRNWDVIDPAGTVHKNGIVGSGRFEAALQLVSLAMESHDARRTSKPSPRQDRVVNVDQGGNITASPIYGGVRRF